MKSISARIWIWLALLFVMAMPGREWSIGAAPLLQDDGVRYLDPVFAGAQAEVRSDLVYGQAIDIPTGETVDLKLDFYELAEEVDPEPNRALFVFIHGGGFVNGSKGAGRRYATKLAEYGYVTASINYRLRQGDVRSVGVPAAVADARMAVAFLREQAETLRLDPARIIVGGSSAGAITALGLGYTDLSLGENAPSSGVQGIVDWWGGLYDLVDQMDGDDPPLAIIHGTEDATVPFSEAEKLRARAIDVELAHAWWPLEGRGHGPHDAERDIPRVVEFFYPMLWIESPAEPSAMPPVEPTATLEPVEPTSTPSDEPEPEPGPESSRIYLPRTDG